MPSARAALGPDADDPDGAQVLAVGVVVEDHEAARIDAPFGFSLVGLTDRVQLSHGALDTRARQPALVQAFFGVDRPRKAIDCHRSSKLRRACCDTRSHVYEWIHRLEVRLMSRA